MQYPFHTIPLTSLPPLAWTAICIAAISLLIAVTALILLHRTKREAAQTLEEAKQASKREQQQALATQRQQMLVSINKAMQQPLTAIIAPLQSIRLDTLPEATRMKTVQALSEAQTLMHSINMLLDFRYTGTAADTDSTFTLPKVQQPKVVFAPLDNSASTTSAETTAQEQPATKVDKSKSQGQSQGQSQSQSQLITPATVKPIVTMPVDDSNAALAANVAWEGNSEAHQTTDTHRFTMLMVDDAPEMCRFARDYFRGEYNVITANNGEQALERLRDTDRIDLVVSDVNMPRMNGLELCHAIKTDLRYSHIPVLLLTGRTEEELEMQGLQLGADDYITKPFNAETLRLRVKKFIEQRQSRLQQFRESDTAAASTLATTDVDEDFLKLVIGIVNENMSDTNFTVDTLCDQLEMSRTYLYKKIVSITGKGPGEFIRTLRMKRGRQLLERGQMQVAEVAAAVGYSTPKRFTENFKQEFDITPAEYMKKAKMKQ